MRYPKNIWEQIKNLSKSKLIKFLEKDGWILDTEFDKYRTYRKGIKKVIIHYHKTNFKNPNLLKKILDDIEWTIGDLKRLKIIK